MKVAAINTADSWFSSMSARFGSDVWVESQTNIPVVNKVLVDSIYMAYEGVEHAHRPFVMIVGRLTETIPKEELPYGITELTWSDQSSATVAYRYDFTDAQIAEMVSKKGLYQAGFELPEHLQTEWILEGKGDVFIVAPLDENAVPAVFFELKDQTTGKIDIRSGYDLVGFMPDVAPEPMYEVGQQAEAEFEDVFAEGTFDTLEDFTKVEKEVSGAQNEESVEYASTFTELMAAAAAKRETRERALQAEAERIRTESVESETELSTLDIADEVQEALDTPIDLSEEDEIMAAMDQISADIEKSENQDVFGIKLDDALELSEDRQEARRKEAKRHEEELRAKAQAAMDEPLFADDDDLLIIEDMIDH